MVLSPSPTQALVLDEIITSARQMQAKEAHELGHDESHLGFFFFA
jgi:hypothetical protein